MSRFFSATPCVWHAAFFLLAVFAGSAEKPVALVLEHKDAWTESIGLAEQLVEAGFEVKPLPLDRSPFGLDAEMIAFGSFSSEHPAYAAYMKAYAADLYQYVDKGHLLLQFTQADQVEAAPPFLPTTQAAKRIDPDAGEALVLSPEHPLMRDIKTTETGVISFGPSRTIWEMFGEHGGFEVMLAVDKDARQAGLMEGAYGQGRILLAAMSFDKLVNPLGLGSERSEAQSAFAKTFFRNLAQHAVAIRERKVPALRVSPASRSLMHFEEGAFTLAVLPDTQVYSLRFPGVFTAQTGWLVQNQQRRNIRYVLHLGDVVNNNTKREWSNARDAMSLLDGKIPYAIAPGNHDYGPSGDASTRATFFNEYFKAEHLTTDQASLSLFEPGKLDNACHLFEAGGRKWILLSLEWGPRDEAVAWANEKMREHQGRTGILITHAYMNNNDRRYDHTDTQNPQHYNPHEYRTPGSKNDGEQLWQKLVKHHPFALTINGHVLGDGTGYLASPNEAGQICHQILANYQMRELGGEGYLRLLEFQPDGKTILVKSYSPVLDKFMTEPDHTFQLEMKGF